MLTHTHACMHTHHMQKEHTHAHIHIHPHLNTKNIHTTLHTECTHTHTSAKHMLVHHSGTKSLCRQILLGRGWRTVQVSWRGCRTSRSTMTLAPLSETKAYASPVYTRCYSWAGCFPSRPLAIGKQLSVTLFRLCV